MTCNLGEDEPAFMSASSFRDFELTEVEDAVGWEEAWFSTGDTISCFFFFGFFCFFVFFDNFWNLG